MKEVLLSASNLCKSYKHNGNTVNIISDASLEIYEGDFTVVMGSSGSGKSTMMYALSGMDRASSGEVIYNGMDISKMSERKLAKLRSEEFPLQQYCQKLNFCFIKH